jgi:hypothetical protein
VASALTGGRFGDLSSSWLEHLTKSSDRIDPSTWSRVLITALEHETRADERSALAQSLVSISQRTGPTEAAQLLSAALAKETDANVSYTWAVALQATAKRLPFGEATRVRREMNSMLIAAMGRQSDPDTRLGMAGFLATVAGQIQPDEAVKVGQVLADGVRAFHASQSAEYSVLQGLSEVLSRMDPIVASWVSAPLSERLGQALATTTDARETTNLASSLSQIARRLDPAQVRQSDSSVIPLLRKALDQEKLGAARGDAAWALAPIAERLGPSEAAGICQPMAVVLEGAIKEETNRKTKVALIRGLTAMVIRIAPGPAIRTTRWLAARMEQEGDWAREPHHSSLAGSFYWIFQGLNTAEAGKSARLVVAALGQEKDAKVRTWLLIGLCLIAERMDAADAGTVCGPVAKEVAESVTSTKGEYLNVNIVNGLSAIISQLHPSDAAKVVAVLIDGKRESSPDSRDTLASALRSSLLPFNGTTMPD